MRLALCILITSLAAAVRGGEAVDLSPNELKEARRLYVSKCARCHKFYEPSSYTGAEWNEWMSKMTRKSKLKPAQAELLARYTERLRQGLEPSPATGQRKEPGRNRN